MSGHDTKRNVTLSYLYVGPSPNPQLRTRKVPSLISVLLVGIVSFFRLLTTETVISDTRVLVSLIEPL